jgi:hypothetical protein
MDLFMILINVLARLISVDAFWASVALRLDDGAGSCLMIISRTCKSARTVLPALAIRNAMVRGIWLPESSLAPTASLPAWARCVISLATLGLLPLLSPTRDALSCIAELMEVAPTHEVLFVLHRYAMDARARRPLTSWPPRAVLLGAPCQEEAWAICRAL